ncbi:hypothetical protein BIY23_01660 [Wolbachia pipientis]|uniref:Porphobilinogen deaminase n=1 Tax=Wolbachia pipientis TaxID=955 RepID=A0A1E7QL49_WOLPI|nr:hypothetical protein BIY23_01660 [Wolbachia pipientis]
MTIKIGTRVSSLAVAQALEVKLKLLDNFPSLSIKIKTSGDKYAHANLAEIGGKGLFIKEIENALLIDSIDIGVHSLKDVPAFYSTDLTIPCTLKRSSPYDVLISSKYNNLQSLPLKMPQ